MKLGNGLKVEGILGCCSSGGVKNSLVSDTEMGVGGTCQWKFCSLTPRQTVAMLLEVCGQVGNITGKLIQCSECLRNLYKKVIS